MFQSLKGRVAVVTGANGGIGKAVVQKLLDYGINVAAIYHSKSIDLSKIVITDNNVFHQYQADITKREEICIAFKKIEEDFGEINYVVNSSGIIKDSLLFMMTEPQFDDVIDVNLKGDFNLMQSSIPYLLNQKNGAAIVNISSVAGIKASPGQANYAASKAGMIAMTKALVKEIGRKNIRINVVAPGYIETEMTQNLPVAKIEKRIPMNRFGKPDEVADVVLFLLSDGASYINGETIVVDGGMIA